MQAFENIKTNIGVNVVGLIAKLVSTPYEEVWSELKKRGVSSIEVCVIPTHSERITAYSEELAKQYPVGMPPCLSRGDAIYPMVEGIKASGLDVCSCHLMLCEAYPAVVAECIPYMQEISRRTGIRQFVISCMFDSAPVVEEFLPHIQEAAHALQEQGITLCYHNHHMDCLVLENGKTAMEMVLENCPDCMVQLDTGWAWYAGMDSLEFMRRYAVRIASVHLKDFASDARERKDDGRFTAVGDGAVPHKEVLGNLSLLPHLTPGKLIIDQDASDKDMYEEIASGVRFVRGEA